MRLRQPLLVLAVVSALAAHAVGGDTFGPEVGDAAPTFDVEDVTGPNKGKTLCYV